MRTRNLKPRRTGRFGRRRLRSGCRLLRGEQFARLLLAAAVLGGCAADPVPRGDDSLESKDGPLTGRIAAVDGYFAQLAEEGLFNGVVLIGIDRNVALRDTYTASGAPEGMAASVSDQFVIASVSKLLTKYAAYSLAQEGRLSLAAPVSRWVGGLPYGGSITIGHLLDHSSGLHRELEGIDDLVGVPSEEFLRRAAEEALEFEPGTDSLYSNVGYQLLAEVLAAVSEEGYDAIIESYVTGPAGMTDTAEYLSRQPERLAQGFEESEGEFRAGDLVELHRFRYLRFYSTVDDLYRFALSLFDPSITPPAVAERMLAGGDAVTHAGAMEGYRAYFYASPEELSAFIFLSNFEDIPFVRITEDIPKILAGNDYEVPSRPNRVAIEVEAAVLARYVGRYRLDVDPDQVFEIRIDRARLEVVDAEGERTVLFGETSVRFFDEPTSDETVEFSLNEFTGRFEMSLIVEGGMRLETTRID